MKKRILSLLPLALVLAAVLCLPAFALTESEVEAQVAATSKEAVTGSVLIWFLCAVAFLKVSQKIDSFLATMGVNVGRTGGSMLAEAMIAARGVSMIAKAGGHVLGGFGRSGGAGANQGASGSPGGFFKGGLIGMAGRHITNSAVRTATTQTAAVHTAQKQSSTADTHSAMFADNFETLSTDAALRAEQIACRLRHILYASTNVQKEEYLTSAALMMGIDIQYRDGIIEITLPPNESGGPARSSCWTRSTPPSANTPGSIPCPSSSIAWCASPTSTTGSCPRAGCGTTITWS